MLLDCTSVSTSIEKLIEIIQQPIAVQDRRLNEQERHYGEQMNEQERHHEEQMKVLRDIISNRPPTTENEGTTPATSTPVATPNFPASESFVELWSDLLVTILHTFSTAHFVSENKKPKVFLTKQASAIYKMLSNLAAQETPARDINALSIDQTFGYMKKQFDPNRFLVGEGFQF